MYPSPMASRSAAPTAPRLDPVALHIEATNAVALAGFYLRKGSHTAAARKATLAMVALRKLAELDRVEVLV